MRHDSSHAGHPARQQPTPGGLTRHGSTSVVFAENGTSFAGRTLPTTERGTCTLTDQGLVPDSVGVSPV